MGRRAQSAVPHASTMAFDATHVPYFPLALRERAEAFWFRNPATGRDHEVTLSAAWVLSRCDGERTWADIVALAAEASRASSKTVIRHVQPFLEELTRAGVVWWRRRPMVWSSPPPPSSVFWNITGVCNLRCRHCAVRAGGRPTNGVPLARCLEIVDDMATFGVREVVLSGGEPLLRTDWYRIAEHARARGLGVSVSTNGTVLARRTARQVAEVASDAQVSIDGATPAVHDAMRGVPGAWERAVRGVRCLVDAGVPVTIGATVTRANAAQIPRLCDLARDLGAQAFRIIPFVPFGRGGHWRSLETTPPAMRRLTQYLLERRGLGDVAIAEMEFECTFDPPPLQSANCGQGLGCGGARSYITITESGDVLPCHFLNGVAAENVLEHDLAWIWRNSRFLNYFRSLTIADLTGACTQCDWLAVCQGSCRAANFARGRLFEANSHCWLAGPRSSCRDRRHAGRSHPGVGGIPAL